MMKGFILYILFLMFFTCAVFAQDAETTTEQLISDIFEQYTAESEVDIDYESFYEDLMFCSNNPINLNQTTKHELERLAFLSDRQIENILSYVYKNTKLQTIYELQLIDGLDMTDIRRMLPFVKLGKAEDERKKLYWQDIIRYGKNEIYLRFDKGLETKEGYKFLPNEDQLDTSITKSIYQGNNIYNSLKYRFHYKDRIFAGITAEKDAGEQFWGAKQKGYDFNSVYVQLNNFANFKTIVLGDYRANFGQGLVLHPDFGIGKSSYVLNVAPRNAGLKKYSSTDEYNFFRGGGATLQFDRFGISAFYSNKMIDGDTLNGSFSSIYKTGLHRTLADINKKNTVNQQVLGGNVTYTYSNFQIGFTAVHTLLSAKLEPQKSVYNLFYFSGQEQTTAGINFRLRLYKLNVFGESAITDVGSIATLNGCSFSPMSSVSFVVLHRYFSPQYDTFYANAFSETSRINNESGLYIGTEIRAIRHWKIAVYADSYRFPWPKYGIDAPSIGKDYLCQLDYTPKRNLAMYWRFKFEEKMANLSGSIATLPEIYSFSKYSVRYNLSYYFGSFYFKNVLEANLGKKGLENWKYGVIASQDVSYKFQSFPLRLDLRYQIFDAVDYDNRFYSYEKDVLYAFSIPMYYGLGSRYYINLQYELNKNFSFWFKIAQTVYSDIRKNLSSGNETIEGNRKTDARFLIKWSF